MKFKLVGMKSQLEEQEKRVDESQQHLRKVEADQQIAKTTLDEVFAGELKLAFKSVSSTFLGEMKQAQTPFCFGCLNRSFFRSCLLNAHYPWLTDHCQ